MPRIYIRMIFISLLFTSLISITFADANPVSLPYLMQKEFDGRDLHLLKVLDSNKYYTRYSISYKSEALKISGIMNVPRSRGPFPVIITCHGYIPPSIYTSGRGLKREQDYFARHGYVVLHPDYRNYNGSDKDPDNQFKLNLGYTEDVINAIYAIKNSELKFINKDEIGLLGHSLGGGVALNVMVTKPDLVKAFVLFAPVSSDYRDNFYRWTMRRNHSRDQHRPTAEQIIERYGSPEANPEFWNNVSAATFIDQVEAPVLLHQGNADHSVPPAWSAKLAELFKQHQKKILYHTYPGEDHEFIKAWPLVMRRSVEFFNQYLK